ncbi:helix-turn-helix domain-containing protein [Anianabacter salinae]|uniref:helix-turn-helix domain-containing protein n=1 Tax=Anianabacter salinae TaxID=2851023 RepID=UPI00225E0C47|nr:helix-turn-helix domain-containing protein [Anianabacter salinae]
MRGERATMGKSLLDVQRELRIKASYIAAIENADPSAFETPGFIAGFVRSYARYLNLDPDWCFQQFCNESGFQPVHGMSSEASGTARNSKAQVSQKLKTARDPFADPETPFAPRSEAILSRIEPGALGSSLVLVALISFIGWGGYTVFNQIQRVEFAPVDQAPGVVAEVDTLQPEGDALAFLGEDRQSSGGPTPSIEVVERLYRPEALDVPVMTARDAPIASLDPSTLGTMADQPVDRPLAVARADTPVVVDDEARGIETALAAALGGADASSPQVLAETKPGVTMVAVRPAWVRVSGADGTILFESIMNAGDTYAVPQTAEPATLRIGESGAVYFAINGQTYGPVGERGAVTSDLALVADKLAQSYDVATLSSDEDLQKVVAELNLAVETPARD